MKNLEPRRTIRNESGVTLLELLVTLVIISGTLASIISYFGTSLRNDLKNKIRSDLKYFAETEMEKRLSLPYNSSGLDAYGSSEGKTEFRIQDEYLLKTQISFLNPKSGEIQNPYPNKESEDTKLKKITVTAAKLDGLVEQVSLVNFKTP
jgi:prepilin-type N-terminal cleavage/methylation domain-containing protein